MHLEITARNGPEELAEARLLGSGRILASGAAVVTTDEIYAAYCDNPDKVPGRPGANVPPGTYRFVRAEATPAHAREEYGSHIIFFVPASAENKAPLVAVHGGEPDPDSGKLRKTAGGIRLDNAFLAQVVRATFTDAPFSLSVTIEIPSIWKFWRWRHKPSGLRSGQVPGHADQDDLFDFLLPDEGSSRRREPSHAWMLHFNHNHRANQPRPCDSPLADTDVAMDTRERLPTSDEMWEEDPTETAAGADELSAGNGSLTGVDEHGRLTPDSAALVLEGSAEASASIDVTPQCDDLKLWESGTDSGQEESGTTASTAY